MKKLRAAIYARVSTGDQSAEMQLAAVRDYAALRQFEVVKEYVDQVTGIVKRRTRRQAAALQFTAMLADAKRRRFDVLLVWKFDRFARSVAALVEALDEFAALKIDFASVTEQIDTTTPAGRVVFVVIAAFAEFEKSQQNERILEGLAHARAKGTKLGRRSDPSIDAKVLRLAADGKSIREIARTVKRSPGGVFKILGRLRNGSEASDETLVTAAVGGESE